MVSKGQTRPITDNTKCRMGLRMASLWVVLANLFYFGLRCSATTVHYVQSTTSAPCPTQLCLTLSEYLSNKQLYFTSDTTFTLLAGEHHLNTTFVLADISNITMRGEVASSVTIILSPEASLSYVNSQDITLSSLDVVHFGSVETPAKSALTFELSHSQIVNVQFIGATTNGNQSQGLSLIKSTADIVNCSFSNGYSEYGGAIHLQSSSVATLTNVNFTNNIATLAGGAVLLVGSDLSLSGNVAFVNNTASHGHGGAMLGQNSSMNFGGEITFAHNTAVMGGAVFIDSSDLDFHGNIKLVNNTAKYSGGGMYAGDSKVTVSGRVQYWGNSAVVDGGGIGFEGHTTRLVLQSPVTIDFYQNRATSGGALFFLDSNAMYVDQCLLTTVERPDCFFTVSGTVTQISDIRMNFIENNAIAAGSVLYGGALQLCQVHVNEQVYTDGLQFLTNISTFVLNETVPYISSNPLKICYCTNREANCSDMRKTIQVRRGEAFNLSLITVGQFDMPVPSTVTATILDDNATLISNSYRNNGSCSDIGFRLFTEEEYIVLTLVPDGPCDDVSGVHKTVEVTLEPCPPGFELARNHCKCEKRLLELNSSNNCDIDTGLVERPGNSWIQPILDEKQGYRGFILSKECPYDYCIPPSTNTVLLNFSSEINDGQCVTNRAGKLCGGCKDGYSLTLNNFECKICQNQHLSLLLAFGFAGIVLIATLFALHMTVATGTINGLILYANIVNICRDVFLPFRKTNVNPLSVFISWVNLDFGIPVCFYDGLDAYAYTWYQLVFPFYLWLLIGVIVFSSKVSTKVGKIFGSNPIAVLATVILMSFTKLLDAAIRVLSHRYLEYPDGSTLIVWGHDGNLTFFKGKHGALAAVSIGIVVFLLLPYIFLLTFGYHLQAYSGKKGFFWINRLKPVLDAYYAPYKKKTRYWPGFLLFVRTALFFTFLLDNINFNYIALEVSSVFTAIAIIAWLSNRLYEKLYVDILEAVFILNICILTSATFHVKTTQGNQAAVTYLSIGIAFVEFMGIVIFHICLRIKNEPHFQSSRFHKYFKAKLMKLKARASSSTTEGEQNLTLATTNILDIREPLLEDD